MGPCRPASLPAARESSSRRWGEGWPGTHLPDVGRINSMEFFYVCVCENRFFLLELTTARIGRVKSMNQNEVNLIFWWLPSILLGETVRNQIVENKPDHIWLHVLIFCFIRISASLKHAKQYIHIAHRKVTCFQKIILLYSLLEYSNFFG